MSQKSFLTFTDPQGLLMAGGDYGDTSANMGTVAYTEAVRQRPKFTSWEFNKLFWHGMYIFARCPEALGASNEWCKNEKNWSRDQMLPWIRACGLAKVHRWPLFKYCIRRLCLFAFNTNVNHEWPATTKKLPDFMGLQGIADWVRAWRAWPLYPLLVILDLEVLASTALIKLGYAIGWANGSLARRFVQSQKRVHGNPPHMQMVLTSAHIGPFKVYTHDQRNHMLAIDFHTRVMPTPISLLAKLIYGTTIPNEAMLSFWGVPADEPPINELLAPLFAPKKP